MKRKLKRLEVSSIPLIHKIADQIGMRDIISNYIPSHGNEKFQAVDSLIILVYNLTEGRWPLYEINDWLSKYDHRCFQHFPEKLNDDCLGRALDKLYHADRASIMTEIVIKMIQTFDLKLDQIHNDSTTIKAYGKYEEKASSGFELKHGYSKDHRPDLKQLLFSLSVSADGFVPIHFKAYPGNRTDDTTHIETWKVLGKISKRNDFIYVADSKVCTRKQLNYITRKGGRIISIVPKTWKLGKDIREELSQGKKVRREQIWRRKIDHIFDKYEYFSLLSRKVITSEGYAIYWIYSNKKSKRDHEARDRSLNKVEEGLKNIASKVNSRNLKTKDQIEKVINKILNRYSAQKFYHIEINQIQEEEKKQIGLGRPGKSTRYQRIITNIYTLSWTRNKTALKNERNSDGVFPLLSTDTSINALDALKAYKYQPKLEKRFTQFKSVHAAAPLLFKRVHRIESMMLLFFLALMIQALIEREVRVKMVENNIQSLPIYPEERIATAPTTSKILDHFDGVSSYQIKYAEAIVEEFRDELTLLQKQLLHLMDIPEAKYWAL